MFSFILKLLERIPQPYRLIVELAIVVLLIVAGFWVFGQIKSCSYDKARQEYQQKEDAWKLERTKLITRAEEAEKRVTELEPKVLAYEKLAEEGKRIDESTAEKIKKIGEEASREATVTDKPADCVVRAERICAKFAELKPPIPIDCEALKRKCSVR
jgi:hypothetical protein